MEILDRALELLEKSMEIKEIDVFLFGAVNLQEGTTRVSYNHREDLVNRSGNLFLHLVAHLIRQIVEYNALNKKEFYDELIDVLADDLITGQ
jgi:GTP1/Obg family GTP-binding protein